MFLLLQSVNLLAHGRNFVEYVYVYQNHYRLYLRRRERTALAAVNIHRKASRGTLFLVFLLPPTAYNCCGSAAICCEIEVLAWITALCTKRATCGWRSTLTHWSPACLCVRGVIISEEDQWSKRQGYDCTVDTRYPETTGKSVWFVVAAVGNSHLIVASALNQLLFHVNSSPAFNHISTN